MDPLIWNFSLSLPSLFPLPLSFPSVPLFHASLTPVYVAVSRPSESALRICNSRSKVISTLQLLCSESPCSLPGLLSNCFFQQFWERHLVGDSWLSFDLVGNVSRALTESSEGSHPSAAVVLVGRLTGRVETPVILQQSRG